MYHITFYIFYKRHKQNANTTASQIKFDTPHPESNSTHQKIKFRYLYFNSITSCILKTREEMPHQLPYIANTKTLRPNFYFLEKICYKSTTQAKVNLQPKHIIKTHVHT